MGKIQFQNVNKVYPNGFHAIHDFNLDVDDGEFIVFVGPSGCGKSTVLRMLAGLEEITSGKLLLDGKVINNRPPVERDIAIVFQDYALYGNLSVYDNVGISMKVQHQKDTAIYDKVQQAAATVDIQQYLNRLPGQLSGGQKKRVALARTLVNPSDVLILDEPTASLNETDSKALLDLMLELKKKGMTSIIISHKLNEISYVADKITVIRDGSTIETLVKGKDDITESRIIKGMVGREIADRFPKREPKIGEVLMEVKDWTVHHPLYSDRKVVDNVNLNVRKGEVVGISGLMGAGRTELAMSLFGKSYGSNISGELYINGKKVQLNTVQEAIKNHLAYVTEDRKGNGLILSNPIKINTTLANLDAISRHTVIDKDKEYNVAVDYKNKLNTKCPTVEQNVGNLSGGNQQKVLLAKWMFTDPDILILDEPTRGIDVGAKYEIYCIINQLVAEGKSVLMISSELPEILGMCDRIYVMNEGKIVGELAGSEATQELIMSKILSAGKKGALA